MNKDYIEALMQLDPSAIIMRINRASDDCEYQIKKINLIRKNFPDVDKSIINAVIIYLYRRFNRVLPTYKYIKQTINTFIKEYRCADAEDALDLTLYKIRFDLQSEEAKQKAKENSIKKKTKESRKAAEEIEQGLRNNQEESVSDMINHILNYTDNNE